MISSVPKKGPRDSDARRVAMGLPCHKSPAKPNRLRATLRRCPARAFGWGVAGQLWRSFEVARQLLGLPPKSLTSPSLSRVRSRALMRMLSKSKPSALRPATICDVFKLPGSSHSICTSVLRIAPSSSALRRLRRVPVRGVGAELTAGAAETRVAGERWVDSLGA